MAMCDICGKTSRAGSNVSHSKRHTKTRWLPNVHPITVMVKGERVRLKACTRCIRSQHKAVRTA